MHEKDGVLTWKVFKGQDVGDAQKRDDNDALEVIIPFRSELRTAIDATPSGNLVYVATRHSTRFKVPRDFPNGSSIREKVRGYPTSAYRTDCVKLPRPNWPKRVLGNLC